MARRHYLQSLVLGIFLSFLGVTKSAAELPFKAGEKLTYDLRWGVIPIGTAILWVRNLSEYNGRMVYHLSAEGVSNSFLSVFYKVDDLVQSFWDAEKFHSLAFQKIQNEGNYHINEVYLFDQKEQKVEWFNSKRRMREFSIPYGVQDAISSLYQFRRFNLADLKQLKMDVHQDEKNYLLTVESAEEEIIKVEGMGKVKTLKVIPHAEHEGMFLRKGTMWVWFTQDAERIPVLVKLKAPIFGKLTAELVKVEYLLEPEDAETANEIRKLNKRDIP